VGDEVEGESVEVARVGETGQLPSLGVVKPGDSGSCRPASRDHDTPTPPPPPHGKVSYEWVPGCSLEAVEEDVSSTLSPWLDPGAAAVH
jgi:hypothetical protein